MSAPPGRLVALDGRAAQTLEAAAAARLVTGALASEPGGVLVRPSPRTRAILAALPDRPPVVAVLPDMAQLLRDVAEHGALGTARARLGSAGPGAWLRIASTGLRHAAAVARQDFEGIVPVLIELERAGLRGAALAGVVLAAPLTDLLLAAGHDDCLAYIVRFLRRQVKTRAGFETLNLGHLLARLAARGLVPDFVLGPVNPCGFRMKPSADAVLAAIRRSAAPVLATEVSAGGALALADGVAYARAHGAAGVVVTLDEASGQGSTAGAP